MRSMFSDVDLDVMARVKSVFNPEDLCNPGKILPTSKGCVEVMLKARSVAV
jgi:glycolate oxidase